MDDITGTFHIWAGSGEHGLYSELPSERFKTPSRGDAGLYVPMPQKVTIPKNARSCKLNLGIRARFISGGRTHAYFLVLRSSVSAKTPIRLANGVEVIDKGYNGPLYACVDNLSNSPWTIEKHDRLFQLVPIGASVDNLNFKLYSQGLFAQHPAYTSIRGEGGFGSTDVDTALSTRAVDAAMKM